MADARQDIPFCVHQQYNISFNPGSKLEMGTLRNQPDDLNLPQIHGRNLNMSKSNTIADVKEEEKLCTYNELEDAAFLQQELPYHHPTKSQRFNNILWFVSGIIVSGIVFTLATSMNMSRIKDGVCAAYSSQWSPISRDVPINYRMVKYDGRFMKESVYRQSAGPEVDAAWESLGISLRPIQLPEAEAFKAGITHNHVRISEKYGGGYPVNMEGLHHLHCLNLLRQSLYFNYDYYKSQGEGAFINKEPILKLHVTHCLDTIRQQLMCTTDTGVLGRVWWNQTDPTPFIDFNTNHKCKNYHNIVQWATEHQMAVDPLNTPDDYLEPPADGDHIYPNMP